MCMVSVVMPAYNAERFIGQAIESVLEQDVRLELIVINDASTDGTEEMIQTYLKDERMVYVKNVCNQGVAESRNIGVKRAKGDYIAFLDADDWWERGKLGKQVKVLKEKGAVLCYTGRKLYSQDGKELKGIIRVKEALWYQQLLYSNWIACSSVLWKREVALEFPMKHDEYHEDYMVWLECLKKYGMAYGIDEPLLCYRMSKKGKSRNPIKSAKMTYGMHRCMGKSLLSAAFYTGSHLMNAIWKYQCAAVGKKVWSLKRGNGNKKYEEQ